ncbi:hypothetical protein SAMN05192563_106223 [Paraburkholderia aspalathi]|uniref:Uncharacterized protein n=1 Tax=Paraburkholderia aspalathi TaxID=1324617 RepID=A0A1I7ERX9_9BURK|nr:hypothetical protein SAMN05192563_106223 [Paraburkholderia aspalathi]
MRFSNTVHPAISVVADMGAIGHPNQVLSGLLR